MVGDGRAINKIGEAIGADLQGSRPEEASGFNRAVSDIKVSYLFSREYQPEAWATGPYSGWREKCKQFLDEIGGRSRLHTLGEHRPPGLLLPLPPLRLLPALRSFRHSHSFRHSGSFTALQPFGTPAPSSSNRFRHSNPSRLHSFTDSFRHSTASPAHSASLLATALPGSPALDTSTPPATSAPHTSVPADPPPEHFAVDLQIRSRRLSLRLPRVPRLRLLRLSRPQKGPAGNSATCQYAFDERRRAGNPSSAALLPWRRHSANASLKDGSR